MNSRCKLPIPSFSSPGLKSGLEFSHHPTDLLDEDDSQSLQTQYEEGAYENSALYGTTTRAPPVASINTATAPTQASDVSSDQCTPDLMESSPVHHAAPSNELQASELSTDQCTPDLVESSPVHHARESAQSNEPADDQDELPLLKFRRVTRSSTRLARTATSVLTDSESSDVTPPASPPDILGTVVAPTPPTSNVSIGADASSSRRKRNSRSGAGASKKKRRYKTKSRLQHSVDLEAKTADAFDIPAHTLILGFHPSQTSLKAHKYYATSTNLFWWIAGDCLGFRRAEGVGASGKPYWFAGELRYDTSHILPYEMQLQTLCCKGFALRNVAQSCSRRGSSDRNVVGSDPNDIREWCQNRKSIRRIVFSNGKSTFEKFAKHFPDWLESGELVPSPHKTSQEAFAALNLDLDPPPDRTIECTIAVAVSPAATVPKLSYSQKRDFWEEHVFLPGLQDFDAWEHSAIGGGR